MIFLMPRARGMAPITCREGGRLPKAHHSEDPPAVAVILSPASLTGTWMSTGLMLSQNMPGTCSHPCSTSKGLSPNGTLCHLSHKTQLKETAPCAVSLCSVPPDPCHDCPALPSESPWRTAIVSITITAPELRECQARYVTGSEPVSKNKNGYTSSFCFSIVHLNIYLRLQQSVFISLSLRNLIFS